MLFGRTIFRKWPGRSYKSRFCTQWCTKTLPGILKTELERVRVSLGITREIDGELRCRKWRVNLWSLPGRKILYKTSGSYCNYLVEFLPTFWTHLFGPNRQLTLIVLGVKLESTVTRVELKMVFSVVKKIQFSQEGFVGYPIITQQRIILILCLQNTDGSWLLFTVELDKGRLKMKHYFKFCPRYLLLYLVSTSFCLLLLLLSTACRLQTCNLALKIF